MTSSEEDKVIPFPVASVEFEAAAVWLARLERGLNAEEQATLVRLRQEKPEMARALEELATFWGELELLEALPRLDRRSWYSSKSMAWGLVAAVLLVSCGLGVLEYFQQKSASATAELAAEYDQTFRTLIGERITEHLPDGSSITLNTNTEVHVRYQGRDRIVDLQHGEAHFSVAHDPARPFGVHAAGHIVQAVGTAFNVRIQEADKIEVTVTNGTVKVLDEDELANTRATMQGETDWWNNSAVGSGLTEGESALIQSSLSASAEPPEVLRLDQSGLDTKLSWQRGVLIFEGEPLRVVLKEFERYTTTGFTLGSEELAELRVGGYFQAGDIDALLLTLDENFQIEAEHIAENRILLLQNY